MKTKNYWIALVGNKEGFIGNDGEVHYGSYEVAAKRFDTLEDAWLALSYVQLDEPMRVKHIK